MSVWCNVGAGESGHASSFNSSMISTLKLYAAQAKLSVMQQITNLSFVLAVYDGRMTSAAPNAQRQSARSASTGIPGHHCSRKPNAVLEARDGCAREY